MARLVIFDDRMRGIDLPEHAVVIGRSKKVDVPISDGILSRKHCSIVPMDSGFRLLDLKSQNGTFVNGERVEKTDLEFDDVIEIGNTVLVLLDTETWDRGEGLTGLRNPVKAQELIQRINRPEPLESTTPLRDPSPQPDLAATCADAMPASQEPTNGAATNGGVVSHGAESGGAESGGAESGGAESGGAESGGAESGGAESGGAERHRQSSPVIPEVEVLTSLVLHEYAKQVLQSSPALRQLIAKSVRELLAAPESGADLRGEARRLVLDALDAVATSDDVDS
jgi:pSer/pThr/pTyr-binding forkhead associated (FHA) protein